MNNERFEQLKKDFLPRFWDTENNVMIYPEFIDGIPKSFAYTYRHKGNQYYVQSSQDYLLRKADRFIPMRPTGLRDKKGTLIYEGDIVKNKADAVRKVRRTKYGEYRLYADGQSGIGSHFTKNWQKGYAEWEIIGNIHEVKE